ncbi:MAG: response regulator [Proteobacteria bacterium]|nr:response regulator [Pseudomonadota bacterium]
MKIEKILVAEDDSEVRWSLVKFLKKEGFSVSEAKDGLEASALLSKEKFDLIITDLNMPNFSGEDLLKLCNKENINSKFIIITAYGDCQSFWKAMKMGVYEYLNKPVSLDELLSLIKKLEETDNERD